jgi:hypothetical protein
MNFDELLPIVNQEHNYIAHVTISHWGTLSRMFLDSCIFCSTVQTIWRGIVLPPSFEVALLMKKCIFKTTERNELKHHKPFQCDYLTRWAHVLIVTLNFIFTDLCPFLLSSTENSQAWSLSYGQLLSILVFFYFFTKNFKLDLCVFIVSYCYCECVANPLCWFCHGAAQMWNNLSQNNKM